MARLSKFTIPSCSISTAVMVFPMTAYAQEDSIEEVYTAPGIDSFGALLTIGGCIAEVAFFACNQQISITETYRLRQSNEN